MKKVLILGFLLLLTACTNEIDTTEVKEEDPVKEEETAMFEDLEITASNTMTLYAEDLMKHTKEINNLTFVDGYF